MGEVLWRLDEVRLGGRPPRLAGVTLEVRHGVTAVMGSSGAGKTSLLNLLVGFERPDGGTLTHPGGHDGFALPLYWAPQDAGLWPHLTVAEHLEAVAPSAGATERIADVLRSLRIEDRAAAYPDDLSMGERSRVAIARALMSDAAVLVMDEPLAHVDEAGAAVCRRAIRDHVAARGTSLVYATHSARAVIGEAERVICLAGGSVLYSGDVEELYRNPSSRAEAECLGEANWLSQAEAGLWLGENGVGGRCYRPERISVEPSDDGPSVVREYRFRGGVAEADLVHEESGGTMRFYCRPGAGRLREGQRVIVKLLSLLLLAGLLAGCGGEAEPALTVREARQWAMPPDGPRIPAPRSMAISPEGETYVLDTVGRVLVFDSQGRLDRQWRMPEVQAGRPEGVCVLADGRIAVADTHYSRVMLFTAQGELTAQFGGHGTAPGQFIYPVGIIQDDQGHIYVCEYGSNDRVQKFSAAGEHLLTCGSFGTEPGQFQRPSGMAWHEGTLYVADAINNRIQAFSGDGEFLGILGGPEAPALHFPYDIGIGSDGCLYVVEYSSGRLSKVDLAGRVLGRYGSTGGGEGQFSTPWGLAVAPGGRIVVADTGNRRIVELRL